MRPTAADEASAAAFAMAETPQDQLLRLEAQKQQYELALRTSSDPRSRARHKQNIGRLEVQIKQLCAQLGLEPPSPTGPQWQGFGQPDASFGDDPPTVPIPAPKLPIQPPPVERLRQVPKPDIDYDPGPPTWGDTPSGLSQDLVLEAMSLRRNHPGAAPVAEPPQGRSWIWLVVLVVVLVGGAGFGLLWFGFIGL